MKKVSLTEIATKAGLKVGNPAEGADISLSPTETAGFWMKDSKIAVTLEPFADHLDDAQAKKIRAFARLHREGEQRLKEREKAKADAESARKAAEEKEAADKYAKAIEAAKARLMRQGLTGDALQRAAERVVEEEAIQRATQQGNKLYRSLLRHF